MVADSAAEFDWQELNPLLDAEINRLPERFRADRALPDRGPYARRGGPRWAGRWARSRAAWHEGESGCGRDWPDWVLRHQQALLAFAVAPDPVRAAVPSALAQVTLQAARRIAAGRALLGASSAVALARGVLRSLALARLGVAALVLFAVAAAGMVVAGTLRATAESESTAAHPRPSPPCPLDRPRRLGPRRGPSISTSSHARRTARSRCGCVY